MIPQGYRLLTSTDVGKTFGVDLEGVVYFDEDVTPTFYLTSNGSLNLTNFCSEERGYLPVAEFEVSSGIYLNGNGYIYYELGGFWSTEADLSGVEITSFNTDYSWNNWFYVKDKSDPYSIIIKNKEGIKLLTKDKDIHFDDDVKVTIDESLLGGGEAKKYSFEVIESDYGGWGSFDISVDGAPFENSYGYKGSGNIVIIASPEYNEYGSGEARITDVSVTGGSFIGLNYDNSKSGRYNVIIVKLTEDNAVISYELYD